MLSLISLLVIFVTAELSGSVCPERKNIFPCSCTNVPSKSKSYLTIVHCYRIKNSSSLETPFLSLSKTNIDVFHLYDSFWETGKENVNNLPQNWLESLNSKEIKILNTPLSPAFACQANPSCRNFYTTRFIISNSTNVVNMTCPNDGGKKRYHWISCMENLEELEFSFGEMKEIGTDFLPIEMKKLKRLNLSNNLISRVDKKSFSKLPSLKILDLSYNRILGLDGFFSTEMKLETLDVSFNLIRTLDESFFTLLPSLKTLNVKRNQIVYLEEKHWKLIPKTLRSIDLSDNPIHCHCNIKWIDALRRKNLVLKGRCFTPENYRNHLLRGKATFLAKVCDEKGKIQKLTPSPKITSKKVNKT